MSSESPFDELFKWASGAVADHGFAMTLAATALLAGGGQLFATHLGIGLSPDSAQYIAGARSIAQGNGLSFPNGDGSPIPITLWPPMYSALLSVPAFLGLNVVVAARWLNFLFMVGIVVLSGIIVARLTGRRGKEALAAAILMAISQGILMIHAWAWSEPTFLFFGLLSVVLLDHFLSSHGSWILIASAVAAGASLLARYAGAAFIIAGAAGFWTARNRLGRSRSLALGIVYVTAASLPGLGWLANILLVSGQAAGRGFHFGGITSPELNHLVYQASLWLVPGRIGTLPRRLLFAAMGVGLVAMIVFGWYKSMRDQASPSHNGHALYAMCVAFGLAYSGILLFSRLYVEPRFPLDDMRYWTPIYVVFVLLGTAAAGLAIRRLRSQMQARHLIGRNQAHALLAIIAWVTFVYLGVLQMNRTAPWLMDAHLSGLGYDSVSWHRSDLMAFVDRLPSTTLLYSNGYDAINVLTKRDVYAAPLALHATAARDENQYNADLARMKSRLLESGGYLIYFNAITWRHMATDQVLMQDLPLVPVLVTDEGKVYQIMGESN